MSGDCWLVGVACLLFAVYGFLFVADCSLSVLLLFVVRCLVFFVRFLFIFFVFFAFSFFLLCVGRCLPFVVRCLLLVVC